MTRNAKPENEQAEDVLVSALKRLVCHDQTEWNVAEVSRGIEHKLQSRRSWRRRRNVSVVMLLLVGAMTVLVRRGERDEFFAVQPRAAPRSERVEDEATSREWALLQAELAELTEATDLLLARQELLVSQLEVARAEEVNRQLRRDQAVTAYWASLEP